MVCTLALRLAVHTEDGDRLCGACGSENTEHDLTGSLAVSRGCRSVWRPCPVSERGDGPHPVTSGGHPRWQGLTAVMSST